MTTETRIDYDDGVVRAFTLVTVLWGVVGMLVGVLIALQLYLPSHNIAPWFTFGRLRPLHTNAVIFAFVGNSIFSGIYYSLQRLCRARLASSALGWIHFWGWQAIIVAAAVTFPLGYTQGKEYAELAWPIDIAVVVVWVVFALNFFLTLARRREKNLYVALWFYIASILTVAVLYIVNNLAIPVNGMESYSIFAGVQDALVQWWYGHNAVAFFLTTPVLGLMYYFLPKAAERPVYSYRLSIVHFWSLIFLYIWAGPHHLLYTALPDWAQSLGMLFSLMLWAPSWGGMLNGLLTLRGAWDKLRTDPVIKFYIAAVTFYGMATFEGPLLSIKSVNAIAHYTDWIIGHVHSGGLGWNGFFAAGMIYWLVPRLWDTKLRWPAWANYHFWLGLFGILLYVAAMWASGINQDLVLKALTADGTLQYPNFIEAVVQTRSMFAIRLVGGSLYLLGFLMMFVNVLVSVKGARPRVAGFTVPREDMAPSLTVKQALFHPVPAITLIVLVLAAVWGLASPVVSTLVLGALIVIVAFAYERSRRSLKTAGLGDDRSWHRLLERNSLYFSVFSLLAILVGGVAELVPVIAFPKVAESGQQPYSPLELAGRDLYVREGCYTCHSQMIRPFLAETKRYGDYSRIEDSLYDHPFQWGSKRTGPDLAREGGKRSHDWHFRHMLNPRDLEPASIMPAYPHMAEANVDFAGLPGRMAALARIGVPYTPADVEDAEARARAEAATIAAELKTRDIAIPADREIVAMIAYLQRLGLKRSPAQPAPAAAGASAAATDTTSSSSGAAPVPPDTAPVAAGGGAR